MEGLKHAVGNKIRDLRILRGISLSELARESVVAKATLSNIEAGEANPTLDTLWNLSIALKVPLSAFFGESQDQMRVIRAADMKPVDGAALRGRLAAMVDIEASRLEFFNGALIKGVRQASPAHLRGVVEHLLVHSGRVKAGPEGKETVLEAGDYLRMEADQPHSYEALTDDAFMTMVMQYPHASDSAKRVEERRGER